MVKRRDVLTTVTACGVGGLAGCAGNNDDAGEDDTDTETETESYDPDNYYGLPECDGSRPIQLINVQGSDGLIENVSTDDLLVWVSADDGLGDNGEYCGYYSVEAGQQAAFETSVASPDEIHIAADDDTSRNRDRVCNQGGLLNGEDAGCVSPDTFRG